MLIGERLKAIRESKDLSQGDIEKRTGLVPCYTSRVEHGHTVPSVATLEKYAMALGIPLYKLFHDGANRIEKLNLRSGDGALWGDTGKERRELQLFARALSVMNPRNRKLLLAVARRLSHRGRSRTKDHRRHKS
jgi:transcriptional regulator with XRE-family HTH domain